MKKSRYVSGICISALVAGKVSAQAIPNIPQPPVREAIDSAGVNRASGGFTVQDDGVSIGDEANGISAARFWTGGSWWHQGAATIASDNFGEFEPITGQWVYSSLTAAIGSTARKFNQVNNLWVNDQGTGETRVQNGSANTYTYTLRDGTAVTRFTPLDRVT